MKVSYGDYERKHYMGIELIGEWMLRLKMISWNIEAGSGTDVLFSRCSTKFILAGREPYFKFTRDGRRGFTAEWFEEKSNRWKMAGCLW